MDNNLILSKIRAARGAPVTLDDRRTVTVRRPSIFEALAYRDEQTGKITLPVESLRKFVTGWEGFNQLDFWGGGTSEPVAFNADLFMEWVVDQPEVWNKLLNEVLSAFNRYLAARNETTKN
jgi:hypothetical protein